MYKNIIVYAMMNTIEFEFNCHDQRVYIYIDFEIYACNYIYIYI